MEAGEAMVAAASLGLGIAQLPDKLVHDECAVRLG